VVRKRKSSSRKPRGQKAKSATPRAPKTGSRKSHPPKTDARKPRDPNIGSEHLEALRTDIAALMNRIDAVERRLDENDRATRGALSRLTQTVGEVNVRLTSVAANVFEVSAMAAKAAEAVDGSHQTAHSRPRIDTEFKP
jgi:hypothetical protein